MYCSAPSCGSRRSPDTRRPSDPARRPAARVILALACLALPLDALAGDTSNENCTYGGLQLDMGSMPDTPGKVNSVPDDFSGLVVCTDRQTKHVYEQYQLVAGKRVGDTRRFDRGSGKLEEVVPYVKGQRHGCVKRYDARSGHLVFEFCVDRDEPAGPQKSFDRQTGRLERVVWVRKRGEQGEATEVQFNAKGQPTTLRCGPQTLVGDDDLWCGRGGREGQVTLYSSEGWPREVVSYKDNVRHGWDRRYHKDGRLLSEARYENDRLVEEHASGTSGGGAKVQRDLLGEDEKETVFFEESKTPRLVVERKKGRVVKEVAYWANGKTKYEKRLEGGQYAVKTFSDDGALESEGAYVERRGGLGLGGLDAVGALKRYDHGALVEELSFDAQGRQDGVQRFYDRAAPKKLSRREKYEKGTLRWSEDVMQSGEVRRRAYAEDGSVTAEGVTRPSTEL